MHAADPTLATTAPAHIDGAGRTAAALLLGVAAFQVALAAGAPLGAFAWGGAHQGTLPTHLRVASAGSAAVNVGLASLAAVGPTTPARRRLLRGASVVLGAGTLMNLASPSWPERLTWTPVAATLCVLLRRRAAPADV